MRWCSECIGRNLLKQQMTRDRPLKENDHPVRYQIDCLANQVQRAKMSYLTEIPYYSESSFGQVLERSVRRAESKESHAVGDISQY